MTIKAILMDLDNTVYCYQTAHSPALESSTQWLAQQLKRTPQEIKDVYAESRRRVNTELKGLASSHSRLLYFQKICEHFQISPCKLAVQAEDLYWQRFFEHMFLRENFLDFLAATNSKSMAIVTDLTARIQFQKMTHLGLDQLADQIVTSEEAGHEKPSPRIFQVACAKLGRRPEELCMIGDSWDRDIEGAVKFGIRSFKFRDHGESACSTEYGSMVSEFSNFQELIHLVNLDV